MVTAILEAALQAADGALTVDACLKLFRRGELPVSNNETRKELVRRLLEALTESYEGRGIELKRVASGYRLQVRQDYARWVSRLWEEKPPRYSRALLETLSLIAYRQPVTRGDIEQVRGVAVSQNIMRTLTERGWIREVGHREVPGRPALYGTTKAFLDYFNLKSLSQLPPLEEIRELIEPVVVEEAPAEPADSAQRSADAAAVTVSEPGAEADVDPVEDADQVGDAEDAAGVIEASEAQDAEADAEEPLAVVSEPGTEERTEGEHEPPARTGGEALAEVVPLARGKRQER
ncbi:MAG: SMC-Scp complex subunit ScpB [Pseudomonadota bacterium]